MAIEGKSKVPLSVVFNRKRALARSRCWASNLSRAVSGLAGAMSAFRDRYLVTLIIKSAVKSGVSAVGNPIETMGPEGTAPAAVIGAGQRVKGFALVLVVSARVHAEDNHDDASSIFSSDESMEFSSPVSCQEYASNSYKPYPLDWRFLPEPILLAKDSVRHAIVSTGMKLASSPITSRIWRKAFRGSLVPPIKQARRLFIHIPKTGGTSISALLYGRNLPHLTASFWTATFGSDIDGIPSFAVLREPLERLSSAYRFLKNGGTDIMAASRYEMFVIRNGTSFEDFVRQLYENPDLLFSITTIRPQSDFVCTPSGDVLVNKIFRLGASDELYSLKKWLNVKDLPRINCSNKDPIDINRRVVSLVEQLYERDLSLYHQKQV